MNYFWLFSLLLVTTVACNQALPLGRTAPTNRMEETDASAATTQLYAQYEWLKAAKERVGEDCCDWNSFQRDFQFAKEIMVNKKQKLLVLGLAYEENAYELLLLNRVSQDWQLQAYQQEPTRLVIAASDLFWAAAAQVLYFTVEQTWSSDGDLSYGVFYQVSDNTLQEVLRINSSGGQDMDFSLEDETNCGDISTSFSAQIDSATAHRFYLTYSYEARFAYGCQEEVQDTLLTGSTPMVYYWEAEEARFLPDWKSLSGLDSLQFASITDWDELQGFEEVISAYCKKKSPLYPNATAWLSAIFLNGITTKN